MPQRSLESHHCPGCLFSLAVVVTAVALLSSWQRWVSTGLSCIVLTSLSSLIRHRADGAGPLLRCWVPSTSHQQQRWVPPTSHQQCWATPAALEPSDIALTALGSSDIASMALGSSNITLSCSDGAGSLLHHIDGGARSLLHHVDGAGSLLHHADGAGSLLHRADGARSLLHRADGAGSLLHHVDGAGSLLHHVDGVGSLLHRVDGAGSLLHCVDGAGSLLHRIDGAGSLLHRVDGAGSLLHRVDSAGSLLHHCVPPTSTVLCVLCVASYGTAVHLRTIADRLTWQLVHVRGLRPTRHQRSTNYSPPPHPPTHPKSRWSRTCTERQQYRPGWKKTRQQADEHRGESHRQSQYVHRTLLLLFLKRVRLFMLILCISFNIVAFFCSMVACSGE